MGGFSSVLTRWGRSGAWGERRVEDDSLPGPQPEPLIEMGRLETNWLVGEAGLWAAEFSFGHS